MSKHLWHTPEEEKVGAALERWEILYEYDATTTDLLYDFYLPKFEVYIEVYSSPVLTGHLEQPDLIILNGKRDVEDFCHLLCDPDFDPDLPF